MVERMIRLKNTDFTKRIYYNYFSNKVKRTKGGNLVPYYGTKLILNKNACIDLEGVLAVNTDCYIRNNGRTSIIRMERDTLLTVKDQFLIGYGADLIIFEGGNLILGKGYFNINLRLRCQTKIEIGNDVAIAHNVLITDTDGHNIERKGYQKTLPVKIGNKVWIGTNVTILKGVNIGDGAIVAANTLVNKDVPPYSLAVGNPMKIVRENVKW